MDEEKKRELLLWKVSERVSEFDNGFRTSKHKKYLLNIDRKKERKMDAHSMRNKK